MCLMWVQNSASLCEAGHTRFIMLWQINVSSDIHSTTLLLSTVAERQTKLKLVYLPYGSTMSNSIPRHDHSTCPMSQLCPTVPKGHEHSTCPMVQLCPTVSQGMNILLALWFNYVQQYPKA